MSTAPRKTLEQVKSSCSVLLGVTHGLLRDGAVTAAHLASHAQACAAAKSEFARVWALLQQSQPDAALLRSAAAASLAVDTAEAERLRLATAAAAINCATNVLQLVQDSRETVTKGTPLSCLACAELTASFCSVTCAAGHTLCATCVAALIASCLGESAYRGGGLICPGAGGGRCTAAAPFDALAVQRVLLIGLPAADSATALVNLGLFRDMVCEAETRRKVMHEQRRNPPTLESQLIEAASVVRCTACEAPFGGAPDACMHAMCECGHKFCAFCWRDQVECRTEHCVFNPTPNSIMCDNKDAAFTVVKACNAADLLLGLPAAQRIATLAAPAVREAFKSAGLDAALPHLMIDPTGYTDALLRSALAARYGGPSGMEEVALNLTALAAGDSIVITSDGALLRHWSGVAQLAGGPDWSAETSDMSTLAGATVRISKVCYTERRLKVAAPAFMGSSIEWVIPFDVVVAHLVDEEARPPAKRSRTQPWWTNVFTAGPLVAEL